LAQFSSASLDKQGEKMKYVYLLQSLYHPKQRYVGLTSNLQQRLATHNQGRSPYTSKFAPWHIVTAIRFDNDQRATAFERYLKSGSGRAFANKHFW
jgi:putative endonuclease